MPVQSLVVMPSGTHAYVVFGFSASLDWTTLHFVKPIDDIRVCTACRVVARKTAFLGCRHVLCEPCYKLWKSRGNQVCFLDGNLCPENEVYWMEFPAEKMMRNQVHCWNRQNGCEIITDVSSITEHFHRDCAYHCACCPKCLSTVLRKDIIAHLESKCTNHVLRVRSTTRASEGELKDLESLRKGVRVVESAFRSAYLNDASLVTGLQGLTVKDKEYVDSLSNVAVEVAGMSQVTKQTLSEVERSSEGHVNQIVEMKTCKESLCTQLDEINRAADDLVFYESADQKQMMVSEKNAEKLQVLRAEMQSVSITLEEVASKVHLEAAVAESVATGGLSDVRNCNLFSYWTRYLSDIPLQATARVFENALQVPAKVVCLDWSTLHFVKPIDDIRVCSACKAVARKTAFLACRHVLCEPCYEHWKSRGSQVCFLDGEWCPENEVHWMEFPVEKMMKTEVSCWNRENGCDTIIDVSSIAEHFHRDCAYHSTSCSVCSSTVLRKDIIAHLESQCVNYVLRIRLTTSRSEEELKDLNDIREGVRGIEMAVRSASRKDGLLVTSLQEVTEKGVDNVDHLSGIAAEASWVSQAMRKTFSEIERSSEGRAISFGGRWKGCEVVGCELFSAILPHEMGTYTLFGFSEDVDRRPWHFVQPIDDVRVCSACRLVPRKSGFLPCRHVLCEPCYDQCRKRGHVCVMDGEACPEALVDWREFPDAKLLGREVTCWNKEYGCEAITTVSSLSNHFYEKCSHHPSRCPKCSATVLHVHMIDHMESHCSAHVLSRKSSSTPSSAALQDEMRGVQRLLGDIKQHLEKAATEKEQLSSKITEVSQQRQDVQEQIGEAVREVKERIEQTLRVIEENAKKEEEVRREFDELKSTLEQRVADVKATLEASIRAHKSQAEARSKSHSVVTQTVSVLHQEVQRMKAAVEDIQHELCPEGEPSNNA
ncbi:hypothetical protein MTO96_034466 [Rhipicephalus appendiculatus]